MRKEAVALIFHEIYGSYYNVVAQILEEAVKGGLDEEKIRRIIGEKAFLESGIRIPRAIRSGSWPFIAPDMSTQIVHVPTMPLTALQRQWMSAIRRNPRIRLFDPPAEEPDDAEPLFDPDFFVYFDRCGDGDPYEDPGYQERFRLIRLALREGMGLQIVYMGKMGRHDQVFAPERLEYSAKDDKFRLLARSARGRLYVINLGRIRRVTLAKRPDVPADVPAPVKKSVTLRLTDERRALERAMVHFSDLEKETVKLDETTYQVTLRYREEDETELLIRILAFGPLVRVTGPESFIGLIKERLDLQKSCGP